MEQNDRCNDKVDNVHDGEHRVGIGHDESDGGEQLWGRMHLYHLWDWEAWALSGISWIKILYNKGKTHQRKKLKHDDTLEKLAESNGTVETMH